MYNDKVIMKKGKEGENNFRLYINNIHVGTVTRKDDIMSLDTRYGTYPNVSKSVYLFLYKLKHSFLMQMKVLGFLDNGVDTTQLAFEFGGTQVIATPDMSLDEIKDACYANSSNLVKQSVYGRRMLANKDW